MQQTSAGGAAEKGGLEFSLANLFKCMCFTHEDPDDSNKQLVNVIFMFLIYFHPFYPFNSAIEALDFDVYRGCPIIIWTGLNIKICRYSSKSI